MLSTSTYKFRACAFPLHPLGYEPPLGAEVYTAPLSPRFPTRAKWIKTSEKRLIAKFGDDYRRYIERVLGLNPQVGVIRLLRRKDRNKI